MCTCSGTDRPICIANSVSCCVAYCTIEGHIFGNKKEKLFGLIHSGYNLPSENQVIKCYTCQPLACSDVLANYSNLPFHPKVGGTMKYSLTIS